MTKQAISTDLVGLEFEPVPVKWNDNDIMLYNIAVGCMPDKDLDFL